MVNVNGRVYVYSGLLWRLCWFHRLLQVLWRSCNSVTVRRLKMRVPKVQECLWLFIWIVHSVIGEYTTVTPFLLHSPICHQIHSDMELYVCLLVCKYLISITGLLLLSWELRPHDDKSEYGSDLNVSERKKKNILLK